LTAKLDNLFVQCKETIQTKEILVFLDELNAQWESYKPILENLISYKNMGNQELVSEQVTPLATIGTGLRDNFLKLFEIVSEQAAGRAAQNAAQAQQATIVMGAVIAAALAISLVLGVYISRIIGTPLVMLAKIANMLAVGDISVDQVLTEKDLRLKLRKDEIGKLSEAYHR
jgi:methyl-accepting chemotaxis protein